MFGKIILLSVLVAVIITLKWNAPNETLVITGKCSLRFSDCLTVSQMIQQISECENSEARNELREYLDNVILPKYKYNPECNYNIIELFTHNFIWALFHVFIYYIAYTIIVLILVVAIIICVAYFFKGQR